MDAAEPPPLSSSAANGAAASQQVPTFRRIAVFCGASSGSSPMYVEAAAALGAEMAARGIGLVYGVRSRVPFAAVALVARD